MNTEKQIHLENAVISILETMIGLRWENDVNFQKTPKRYAKYLLEYSKNLSERREEAKEQIVLFPTKKRMIISPDIIAFSMCPHHLLPVEYNITIGYMMKEGDEFSPSLTLGASKLTRIVQIFAKAPVLQEDLQDTIAEFLNDTIDITGCAILISGVHMCMRCRGVKTRGAYLTPYMDGCFVDNEKVRNEFYNSIMYERMKG